MVKLDLLPKYIPLRVANKVLFIGRAIVVFETLRGPYNSAHRTFFRGVNTRKTKKKKKKKEMQWQRTHLISLKSLIASTLFLVFSLRQASLSPQDVEGIAQDLLGLLARDELDTAQLESMMEFVYQRTTATLWQYLQDSAQLRGVLTVCCAHAHFIYLFIYFCLFAPSDSGITTCSAMACYSRPSWSTCSHSLTFRPWPTRNTVCARAFQLTNV